MLVLLIISLFIVSGDLFFVFHVGGFTVRMFQISTLPVVLGGIWALARDPRAINWPLGFKALLLWTVFMLLFIPNTTYIPRSVGYAGWLLLDVFLVLGVTTIVRTPAKLRTILRWYIYSFAFCAVFGLLQVILPLLGLPGLLVEQWWFPGILARINGFSYEPSYYATYMLTGWVFVDYLRYRKVMLVSRMNLIFWLMTAALILCTSRLGWVLMIAWLAIRTTWQIRQGQFNLPWKWLAFAGLTVFAALSVVAARYQLFAEDLNFLGRGLGVLDASDSYSSLGRLEGIQETLSIFSQHPVIGVSVGGVASARGEVEHSSVLDQESAKGNEGFCVTMEALAASGLIGFIPFVVYIFRLIRDPIRRSDHSEFGLYLKALGWSFLFLYLALQVNSTILRNIVWLHIGLLSAAYRVFWLLRERKLRALGLSLAPTPPLSAGDSGIEAPGLA